MASTIFSFTASSPLSLATNQTQNPSRLIPPIHPIFPILSPTIPLCLARTRRTQKALAAGSELGDFGARDPFPAEIASNFADKVLGNVDTEHRKLIPNSSALSMAMQDCSPISASDPPLSLEDSKRLLLKIVGWKLTEEETGMKLHCIWKLRDTECAEELMNRIYKVAEHAGHTPYLRLEQPNQVIAELWTPSIGGLSMNDFILAARIDMIKISDLIARRRVWA